MSANNAKVQAVIETTFNSAINKLAANEAGNCYSCACRSGYKKSF